jgi:hypothetical protein
MGIGGSFPGGEAAGTWSHTSTPSMRLHGVVLRQKAQGQIYIYLAIIVVIIIIIIITINIK